MKICKTCKHYNAQAGECRQGPPVVIVAGGSPVSVFPVVEPGENCGAWVQGG